MFKRQEFSNIIEQGIEFDLLSSFRPEKFLNSVKNHLVLFYEESMYAKRIMYQFIKNGLANGESCIYAMDEEPELVEREMLDFGIDTIKFKEKNLLHIYQTELITNFNNIIQVAKNTLGKFFADSQPPYRIVSRIVPQVNTKEGIMTEIKLEKWFQSNFSQYDCTFLCPYLISKIESINHNEWMQELVDTHHIVILAPSSETGFAFKHYNN